MPARSNLRSLLASATLAVAIVSCSGPGPAVPSSDASLPASTGGSSSEAPTGSLSTSAPGEFESVDVAVILETGTTVEALIPVEGGRLTTTGADGATYTLDIPSDALLVETTIGLTPVASLAGLPFGGETTYAVQMAPNGLFLQNFAVLTIEPAVPIAIDQQIMFGYLGDGEDVILAPPVVDSPEIKINILHFSGAGVTNGTLDDGRTQLGSVAERQLQDAIAETLAFERQHQLMCADCPPTVDAAGMVAEGFRLFDEQVVQVRVDAAAESCDAGKLALQTVLGVARQRELLGMPPGPDYPGLIDRVARSCVIEEFEACVEHHRFFLMAPIYLGMARQNELAPTYSAGTMAEAKDLTAKCLTFRLEFESTATDDRPGASYTSSVEATIMLRWNPTTHLTGGIGVYENTFYEFDVPSPCDVTEVLGGGRFVVLALLEQVEAGELRGGGYPDAHVADFNLTYMPDHSTEGGFLKCGDAPPQPMPFPAWSMAYFAAHVLATGEWAGPGLGNVGWTIKGGELFATNEWHVAKDTVSENGSFELYHVPGE